MGQAAAARAARLTHGRARPTRPCAALGRGGKHVAAAAAGADNMMHSIPNVYFDEQHFYMGKSLPTAAQSPRSVRPGGPVWDLRNLRACGLHAVVAVSIRMATASSGTT